MGRMRSFVEPGHAPKAEVEGIGIWLPFRPTRLSRDYRSAQLIGQPRHNLILHLKEVGDRLVGNARPTDARRSPLDELDAARQCVSDALDAALEDGSSAKPGST